MVAPAPEAEKVAALSPTDAPAETTKTDAQPAEAPVASDAAPVPAEEAKVATTEEAKPPASEALPLAPEAAESEPANADIVKSEPEPEARDHVDHAGRRHRHDQGRNPGHSGG